MGDERQAVLVWADGRTLLARGVEGMFHVRTTKVGDPTAEEWFEYAGYAFAAPERPCDGPPPRDAIAVYVQRPRGGYRE